MIVDDEAPARSELRFLLDELGQTEVVAEAASVREAIEKLKEYPCDVMFLDINMPEATGLQLADALQHLKFPPAVVFVTAYSEFALDAFKVHAIDYLVKPIETERFQKAVQKALSYHSLLMKEEKEAIEANVSSEYFFVKSERKYFKVNYADILFIEGLKDYVILQLPEQRIITRMNMKGISELLPQDLFLRVNKSYIVNTRHIDSFDNNDIYIGNYEIAIGNSYRDTFFEEFLMKGKRKG